MVKALNTKHKKVIQFILDEKRTTYDDLAYFMNQSKRTIAKDIKEINDAIDETGSKVVVKQNIGVYLDGDARSLWNFMRRTETYQPGSKNDRVMYIYSRFLSTSHHLKVQELADELYVSRSTLEDTLKEVRKKFNEQNFYIENSKDGMQLKASEKERRNLMSHLINYYWGGLSRLDDKEDSLISQLKVTPNLKNILNVDIMHRVISILNVFLSKSHLACTDYEYKSLAIHLTISLERIMRNKFLNFSERNINLLENTRELTKLIEKNFSITLPQFEKEYINNHIMAIEINAPNSQNSGYKNIGTDSNNINHTLWNELKYLDADEELIKSLTLHLESAIKRLQLGLSIHNPYTEKIKMSFPRAFDNAVSAAFTMEKIYDIQLNDDEVAFIALHIEAFFERCSDGKQKKNVVLVCSSGLGTSKLLEQRMKDNFPDDLRISRVLSLKELELTQVKEDVIISTIPLHNMDIPVVVVSPLLDTNDINAIEKELNLEPIENQKDAFLNHLAKGLLFIERGKESKNNVLNHITNNLLQKGYAKEGVLESALQREKISSTAMNAFAMPHAQIEYILNPAISIYINKNGIDWDGKLVNIVFFFALNKEAKPVVNEIYDFFNYIISDGRILKSLSLVNSKQDIFQLLKEL